MSLSGMCSPYQSSTVRYWLSLGLSARVEGTRAAATSRRIWDFMLGVRSSLVLMLNLEFSLDVKVDGSGRRVLMCVVDSRVGLKGRTESFYTCFPGSVCPRKTTRLTIVTQDPISRFPHS